eukprot:TRINITY_DN10468_c0_g1_i6.p1 TRINITY_DN10468_c0_g1~~TRINITY_DN10468_c0_g1_i6.p1  ORF type:complete len:146 (+),score=20.10 TRINITY_DN10468_c0_g1_i6:144-581(+)
MSVSATLTLFVLVWGVTLPGLCVPVMAHRHRLEPNVWDMSDLESSNDEMLVAAPASGALVPLGSRHADSDSLSAAVAAPVSIAPKRRSGFGLVKDYSFDLLIGLVFIVKGDGCGYGDGYGYCYGYGYGTELPAEHIYLSIAERSW